MAKASFFELLLTDARIAIPITMNNSPLYIRRAPEAKIHMITAKANDESDGSYPIFILRVFNI